MFRAVLLGTLVLGFANLSMADEHGKGPCAKDREALCGSIEPGEGRVMKCMADNKDKLSSECKAHHEKIKEHGAEIKEACQEDRKKYCADVEPGHGRIVKCMKENKEKLSEACKAEVQKMKKHKKKNKDA